MGQGNVSVVGNTQDDETGQRKDGRTVVPIQSHDNGLTAEQAVMGRDVRKRDVKQVKRVRLRQVGLRE